MKNVFLLVGAGVAGYGIYLLLNGKSGCGDKTATPNIVPKTQKQPLYSDAALERYDTDWHSLFPTPSRLGVGALSVDNTDTFTGVNFVHQ